MNRMGPMILVLAAANAVAAAAMAGAVAAVAIFVGLLAAGFLFLRWQRGGEGAGTSAEPVRDSAPATGPATDPAAGPVGRQAVTMGRQGAWLLVRLDGRDWPARPAPGAAQPGYGDAVRIEAVEGAVLVVRPAPRAIT